MKVEHVPEDEPPTTWFDAQEEAISNRLEHGQENLPASVAGEFGADAAHAIEGWTMAGDSRERREYRGYVLLLAQGARRIHVEVTRTALPG